MPGYFLPRTRQAERNGLLPFLPSRKKFHKRFFSLLSTDTDTDVSLESRIGPGSDPTLLKYIRVNEERREHPQIGKHTIPPSFSRFLFSFLQFSLSLAES